jgi:hypothetical protein
VLCDYLNGSATYRSVFIMHVFYCFSARLVAQLACMQQNSICMSAQLAGAYYAILQSISHVSFVCVLSVYLAHVDIICCCCFLQVAEKDLAGWEKANIELLTLQESNVSTHV